MMYPGHMGSEVQGWALDLKLLPDLAIPLPRLPCWRWVNDPKGRWKCFLFIQPHIHRGLTSRVRRASIPVRFLPYPPSQHPRLLSLLPLYHKFLQQPAKPLGGSWWGLIIIPRSPLISRWYWGSRCFLRRKSVVRIRQNGRRDSCSTYIPHKGPGICGSLQWQDWRGAQLYEHPRLRA